MSWEFICDLVPDSLNSLDHINGAGYQFASSSIENKLTVNRTVYYHE